MNHYSLHRRNPHRETCPSNEDLQSENWERYEECTAPCARLNRLTYKSYLTLILLTWEIGWAPNNAKRWQMGFNLAFKGLKAKNTHTVSSPVKASVRRWKEAHILFWLNNGEGIFPAAGRLSYFQGLFRSMNKLFNFWFTGRCYNVRKAMWGPIS